MYKDKPYVIDIKLALSGANDFKKKLRDIFQSVPDFQSRLHDMGIKDLDKQLEQLSNRAGHYYDELYNAVIAYTDATSKKSREAGDGALKEAAAEEKLIKAYKNALGTLPLIKKEQEAIEQVVRRSFKYQEEALLKNLELLKKEQVDSIKLIDLKHQLLNEAKAANSTAPLQKANKEFEKRLALMQKLKDIQETANRVGLHTEVAVDYTRELKDLKADLTDLNTPVEEIQNKLKHLSISPTLLKDIGRAEEKFRKAREQLKKLGTTKTELSELDTEFSYLIDRAVRLGDATDVKEFNTSLKKRKNIIQDLVEQYNKLDKAQLKADDKKEATGKISSTRAVALDFNVDTDTLSRAMNNVKLSVKDLTTSEKQFKKEIDASANALEKQKQKLMEEKRVLADMLAKNKSVIDKDAQKQALDGLNKITDEIKQIDTLIGAVKSQGVFDAASVQQSKDAVAAVKEEVRGLKETAGNIKVNIQLSGGIKEAKEYAISLASDMQKVANAADKSSQQYKEMSLFLNQVALQQDRLNEGDKENYKLAKQNLQKLAERYQEYQRLNAEATKLSEYVHENRAQMGAAADQAEEYVQKLREAATAQLDLTNNTREHKKTLAEVDQFQSKIQNAQKERANLDKQLYNLSIKLKNELANIERLKNSKKPYATTKALEEANQQADELRQELKRVETIMEQLGRAKVGELIEPGVLSKTEEQVKELNRAFDVTSAKVKDVKANLAELSSVKWGGNILKRAVAYSSMYAGIYELISGMRRGAEAVVQFDTQMRTISAVFDVTQQRAKGLTQELMKLGLAYGGSVQDINEAALSLGRAGIATEKVTEATEVVIKMAKLTGDTIATSANAIITYQQVFGDTHPVLKEIGDQLAYVANQSRMSTQDIGTFSNYALAAASAAGISMEAINAMATAFSNAGVNASTIGTQIRRFSSLMKDNSTAAQDFFIKLGTTQELFAQQMQESKQSADEAMTWIAQRLKKMSKQEFAQTIQGMDILASNSITLLRNNADEFLRHFQNLNAGVSGEIDKANLIADGYQASFEKMKTAISQAFIALTDTAAPVIQELMDKVTALFEWIAANPQEILDSLGTAFKTLGAVIVMNVGIRATSAFKALLKVMSGTSESVKLVQTLFTTSMKDIKAAIMWPIAAISKLSTAIGTLVSRIVAVRAAGGVLTFKTLGMAITTTTTAMWRLIAASIAFIATPLGAVLAVLGAAIGAYVYFTDDATESTDELSNAQSKLTKVTEDLTENKRRLAEVMQRLNKGTSENAEEDIKAAAALELAIRKGERAKKIYGDLVQQKELLNQKKVKEQEITILKKEITTLELENSPSNGILIAQLEKQIERLKQDVSGIELKVTTSQQAKEAFQTIRQKLDNLVYAEHQIKIGAPNTAGWKSVIQIMKQDLENLGVDVDIFKKGDIDAKLEAFIQTAQGKLATKQLQLKLHPNMDPAAKAKLEAEIAQIKEQLEKAGNFIVKPINKEALKNFADYGKGIMEQFKAGLDISPQAEYFAATFKQMFNNILLEAQTTSVNLRAALDSAMPKDADQGLITLVSKIKDLNKAFGKAKDAREMQVILTDMKNAFAELATQYGTSAPQVVSSTQAMINETVKLNDEAQKLTGTYTKVFSNITGTDKMHQEVEKMSDAIDRALAAEKELDLTKGQILQKLVKNVDLTYAIKNGQLSVNDAVELEKKIQDILVDQKMQLMALDNARIAILNDVIKFEDAAAKAAALDSIAQAQKDVQESAKQQIKNLEAAKQKLKSAKAGAERLAKQGAAAAKSAANHADQVERAATALKKLEAGYIKITGISSPAFSLGIEADIEKIQQMVKKAEGTGADYKRIRDEYFEAKNTEVQNKINDSYASRTDVEVIKEAWAQEKRLQQQKEFYAQKEALRQAQYEADLAWIDESNMTVAEKERARQELELQNHQQHLANKRALDEEYYLSLAQTVNAGLGDVLGIMEQLYSDGLIKSKKWIMAMKAIKVAQAIMNTYTSATTAYNLGLEAGGPWGGPALASIYAGIAIAKGMAQVAIIKAQKFHTGGYVDKPLKSGIGGQQDDEVNAVLQKGEYVLSKSMVQDIKKADRNKMKKEDYVDDSQSASLPTRELANFADAMKPEVVIVNSTDPAVVEDWATSRRGREVIQNVVNGG